MLRVLRELESNAFAMLLALFAFLLVLLLIAAIASVVWGVDWNAVMGIAGMGTGGTVNGHVNQMLSNRSPNYAPLVAQPGLPPLPTASPLGGSPPPGAHV